MFDGDPRPSFGDNDTLLLGPGYHGHVLIGPESCRHGSGSGTSDARVCIRSCTGQEADTVLGSIAFLNTSGWTLQGVTVCGSMSPAPPWDVVPGVWPWTMLEKRPLGIHLGLDTSNIHVAQCVVRDDPDLNITIRGSHHTIDKCEVVRAGGIHCLDPSSSHCVITGCSVQFFSGPAGLLLRGSHMHVDANAIVEALDVDHITDLCISPDPSHHVQFTNNFLAVKSEFSRTLSGCFEFARHWAAIRHGDDSIVAAMECCHMEEKSMPTPLGYFFQHTPVPSTPTTIPAASTCTPSPTHGFTVRQGTSWEVKGNIVLVDHPLAMVLEDTCSSTVVANCVCRLSPRPWFTTRKPCLESVSTGIDVDTGITPYGNTFADNCVEKLHVTCAQPHLSNNTLLKL